MGKFDKYRTDSRKNALDKLRVLYHGPPKCGKTFMAASTSVFWPKELGEGAEWVSLDDMIWIPFDAGALDGFMEHKIVVPHMIDVLGMLEDGMPLLDVLREAPKLVSEIASEIRDKGLRPWVVTDTVSALDKAVTSYWDGIIPEGKHKGFGVFRSTLTTHLKFYSNVTLACPCAIACAHSKYDFSSEMDPEKAGAKSADPESVIRPSITGQARDIYLGNSGLEAVVLKQTGRSGVRYALVVDSPGKFETASRWAKTLGPYNGKPVAFREVVKHLEGLKGGK